MKDLMLEKAILKILAIAEYGLREKTLMDETEIAVDRPYLATDDFRGTIAELFGRGLVERRKNLMGETVWAISELGNAALKGV